MVFISVMCFFYMWLVLTVVIFCSVAKVSRSRQTDLACQERRHSACRSQFSFLRNGHPASRGHVLSSGRTNNVIHDLSTDRCCRYDSCWFVCDLFAPWFTLFCRSLGLISPWNLPLYLLTWKIAPCIATGYCWREIRLVKPCSQKCIFPPQQHLRLQTVRVYVAHCTHALRRI